jgi:hypothetical protein
VCTSEGIDARKLHNIPKIVFSPKNKTICAQKRRQDNIFHRILQLKQMFTILQELHGGIAKRHFSSNINMQKILDVGYRWPMMN